MTVLYKRNVKPKGQENSVLALFVADIHLCYKPPIARSAEEDWHAAMRRPLEQISQLLDKYKCPLVIAGDIFDDGWRPHRCPPSLLNFALRYLPKCYAVAGNHDLPHHDPKEIHHSAIGTLIEAGNICSLEFGEPIIHNNLRLHGFHCGVDVEPLKRPHDLMIEIAVIHDFIWQKDSGYVGAPEEKRLKAWRDKLVGYDVVIFGDNHISFHWTDGKQTVVNCGSLMRRTIDQKDFKPAAWLLYGDGTVVPHYLDVGEDKFLDSVKLSKAVNSGLELDLSDFIEEVNDLGDTELNFQETVIRYMDREQTPEPVKNLVLEAMGSNSK